MSYTFAPQIKKSNLDQTHNGEDFLSRMENFRNRQEKKLESIRQNIVDPSAKEFTFKPKLSEKSSSMKRNLNDLYVTYFSNCIVLET